MKQRIVLLLAFLLLTPVLFAKIIWKQENLVPNPLFIGNPVEIRLRFDKAPNSVAVSFPDSIDNFNLRKQELVSPKGELPYLSLQIVPFETGRQTLPVVSVQIKRGSESLVARTSPFTVEVKESLPKQAKTPKEIAPPVSIYWGWIDYAALVLLLLLLTLIVLLVLRWVKHKKHPPITKQEVPKIVLPWELALQELARLQEQHLLEKGELLTYCFGLSYILRLYLEKRFAFTAVEMTTYEIKHSAFQHRKRSEIIQYLQDLDKVKFAKHELPISEGETYYQWLYRFLKTEQESTRQTEGL